MACNIGSFDCGNWDHRNAGNHPVCFTRINILTFIYRCSHHAYTQIREQDIDIENIQYCGDTIPIPPHIFLG